MLLFFVFGFTFKTNQTGIKDTRNVLKALYIYNFATLVDWPSEYRKGDFVVGVYGSNESIYDELNTKYSGKAIGSQEIVIKKFSRSSDIDKAHILYLSQEKSDEISSLSTKFKGKSTLLITEKDGYLNKGAVINFVIDKNNNNKQSYEISIGNAKKHNLIIASKLESLAARVIK